jgi:hypothetical protein
MMNERIKAIVDEARKLTPGERLELFDQLKAEFAAEADAGAENVEAAQLKEVERTVSQAASGEAKSVDFAEILSRVRRLNR